MKKILLTFVGMSLVFSCSTEEKYHSYTKVIRNISNEPLYVLILGDTLNRQYPVYDTLINKTLNSGESVRMQTYHSQSFFNDNYRIYYSKFMFTNNKKGYICEKGAEENLNLCFQNKVSITEAFYKSLPYPMIYTSMI